MSQYLGFVAIGSTIKGGHQSKNTSTGAPVDADALPTYRVYGQSGLMPSGTGSLALKDTGTITAASNASPIVITCTGHGLTTGTQVTISGVGGNTAANGTFVVTRVDASTFSLQGSTGNAPYTSGGSWHVSGLYAVSIQALLANGYAQGVTYTVLVSWAVSSVQQAELLTFTVV